MPTIDLCLLKKRFLYVGSISGIEPCFLISESDGEWRSCFAKLIYTRPSHAAGLVLVCPACYITAIHFPLQWTTIRKQVIDRTPVSTDSVVEFCQFMLHS